MMLLKVFLGGRAAEELIFGRDTSRASVSYLADASWLARKIITMYVFFKYLAILDYLFLLLGKRLLSFYLS